MKTMQLWGAAGALLLVSTCSAFAQDSKKFVAEAIQGNLAEIAMGQLAQSKGQSDGVRAFGKTLETDHSAAKEKAIVAAQAVGARTPSEPNAKQKKNYATMSKLSGAKFDREFADHMVKDHKMEIAKYSKEAKGSDPVASYAKDTLPDLKKHLETAQSLQKQPFSSR
jgi:putative membrane protein